MRKSGSSVGAVIEVVAEGVPAGLGAPVYAKLDGDLASALMGINAVKGVEIGDGFEAAVLSGEDNADEMRKPDPTLGNDGKPVFLSNHAGGILGGYFQRTADRGAFRGQADIVDSHAAQDRWIDTATIPKFRPKAATTPASAFARSHRRSHGGVRAGRSLSDASRQMGEATAWPFKPSA